MSIYEIGVIGNVSPTQAEALSVSLTGLVTDFGLEVGRDVMIRYGAEVKERNRHAAVVSVYFGSPDQPEKEIARAMVRASSPVIPVVSKGDDFPACIPDFLQHANAFYLRPGDKKLDELASAMLECVGLLRRQRRVFVSYRRIEARSAAMQLHDLLSACGFDVFLDTHDVRPGEPFQEVLWQRLYDSDVMVMLDTPTYFASKWTRQELGRARAKEIHVLRVIWPDHKSHRVMEFGESVYLAPEDLSGADGPIVPETAERIVRSVEGLRSRSIASRYMSITGKLRVEVERVGAKVTGIGAHRAISILLEDGRTIWAYPVVGVPTAELLNDVATKAREAHQDETPMLVYDHLGIGKQWRDHLEWLDANIASVRAVAVVDAADKLPEWETEE
ncbi:toll/interleukin-1 receptor domain-containing protein [Paraburkholderia sp. C35]|uniref:toll/interleukin-1 receptor domain-containing protein n=1 Tax=Paraburkholderia sp. C35 TaxID=2126993 RepID=UPI000D699CD4|nr:toll/interleukin-1 receptor domain-containing protein [Paraburkholderia sp. C35]